MTVVDGAKLARWKGLQPRTEVVCERLSRGGGGTSVLLVKSLLAKGGGIRLHRTIFTTMASGHRMKYPTFLPRIITSPLYHRHFPRHVLISPPAPVYVREFFFLLFFFPYSSNENQTSSSFAETIPEAIITKKSSSSSIALNAYPFIRAKQHLRKLDRFRIQPSGSRIIVLLPGN